jgi:hypothetical protein
MSMRVAVIVALVGASIQTLLIISTVLAPGLFYSGLYVTALILASVTQVVFFAVLLAKQKGASQ